MSNMKQKKVSPQVLQSPVCIWDRGKVRKKQSFAYFLELFSRNIIEFVSSNVSHVFVMIFR